MKAQSQHIDNVVNILPDARAVITAELVLGAGGEGEAGDVAGL